MVSCSKVSQGVFVYLEGLFAHLGGGGGCQEPEQAGEKDSSPHSAEHSLQSNLSKTINVQHFTLIRAATQPGVWGKEPPIYRNYYIISSLHS